MSLLYYYDKEFISQYLEAASEILKVFVLDVNDTYRYVIPIEREEYVKSLMSDDYYDWTVDNECDLSLDVENIDVEGTIPEFGDIEIHRFITCYTNKSIPTYLKQFEC